MLSYILLSLVMGAQNASAGLISAELWETAKSLHATDAATTAQIPNLKAEDVRELSFETVDMILARAALRHDSMLDLFTDDGLRGRQVYFLSADIIRRVCAKYDVPAMPLLKGQTMDGRHFQMQALFLGRNRIDMFYDLDEFTFHNPYYADYHYTARRQVTEWIDGPGDLRLQGVTVNMPLIRPKLKRFLKIAPNRVRVYTSYIRRTKALLPIALRAPAGTKK